ncbi:AraC family transcriptional regulator [Pyxidicoccus parkwayensis]|uniref:AraC family transcriptional regulator n=1 Tax=Pyxidicoccus parkwayensis TaxID=2813578 RepID=A0ABX7NPQ4_9BACT|nr:AraC family transcriptional regulator [Pyxidicoccus parkwaysis]QSQ20834.1 AraC family transcriptional regulator [Pyxidicoccus parkwaysis]
MDVLANVLGVTQLGNTMLCQSELLSPWGLDIEANTKTAVHLVQRGVCWLRLEGEREPMRLVPGDVVLVGSGVRHFMTDDPGSQVEPWEQALEKMKLRIASLPQNASADTTVLLCAAYEFEQHGQHPLLALLPKLIRLNVDYTEESGQFQALVRLLAHESGRKLPGSEIVIPRLVDSLFVYIVRAWMASQPVGAGGWFGALRDPQIGRALSLIHENPEQPWTVESLAARVALSRAAFARRFVELVGEPPLKYLTRWRMSLAAKILKTTTESVDVVAARVGYDSPTGFGKAFQRYLRVAPGRYRSSSHPERAASSQHDFDAANESDESSEQELMPSLHEAPAAGPRVLRVASGRDSRLRD